MNADDIDPEEYIRQFKFDPEARLWRNPNSVLASPTVPGDGINAPFRIVLHRSMRQEEWVTHLQNMQNRGFNYGSYHDSWPEAFGNFKARCEGYAIDWSQSVITTEEGLDESRRKPRNKARKLVDALTDR